MARRDASNGDGSALRSVDAGTPDDWFVCLAPHATSFDSVRVTP